MKILNINKYFYKKGGAETYYFALNELLEKKGHQVIHFSMKHEENEESRYKEYFVDHIDYFSQKKIGHKVRNAGKIIYSFEAARKIELLIRREKPDIAHLQNFHHQLSGSILKVLKKYKIPVVYTAHDLKIVCGNYKMLSKNKICESCRNGRHIECLRHRCVKDSLLGSFVNTFEMYLAKWTKQVGLIDYIIAPSYFYKEKLHEFGISNKKLVHISNFISEKNFKIIDDSEDYFVYFGRISEEKGIFTLLKAMEITENAKLKIVGTGPLENKVKEYIKEHKLDSRVSVEGYKNGNELTEILKGAIANILPSEWYENSPYSVLEIMAMGKPTIAAAIGGLPDLVIEQKTGLLFKSKNYKELSQKMHLLNKNKNIAREMGRNARLIIEKNHTEENYYKKLIKVYQLAIRR